MYQISSYLELMRVKSWIKNLFVFSGLLFSGLFTYEVIGLSLIIFVQFCLVSSSIYCLNDVVDSPKDLYHPVKKNRPIPSGKISRISALYLGGVLALTSFGMSLLSNKEALILVSGYFFLNLSYSLKLKLIPLVEIICISIGFLLRIFAGTYPIKIVPSNWLLFCGFSITFFIATSKRFLEYRSLEGNYKTRPVLEKYNNEFLMYSLIAFFTMTIMGYLLYLSQVKNQIIYLSIFPVLYGLLEYLLHLTKPNQIDDPVKIIITNKKILISIFIYVLIFIYAYL